MIYAGIDYSLTSPSLCSFNSEDGDFLFENCDFSVLSDKKVPKGIAKNIFIYPHKPWKTSDERYHNIADHFMQMDMLKFKDKILIEDYSMGSKGKVFHIAENTEVLQYNLYLAGKEYHKIPPTSLKKWATGKGNSDKEKMYEKFLEIEGIDLKAMFGLKKADSPLSDIVDSYFLAKYAFENL